MTNPWKLTEREIEVLQGFTNGGRAKTIARDLAIEPKTVEQHAMNLRRKMKAKTIVAAVLIYDRWARPMPQPAPLHATQPAN